MMQPKASRVMQNTVAVFQATTNLHSQQPDWVTLSLLPEYLVISRPMQFISLASITRIWVSSDLAEQVTCIAYKDGEGRTQTLALRIHDRQGQAAGEQLKALFRQLANHPIPATTSNNEGWFHHRVRQMVEMVTGHGSNLAA